MSLPCLPSCLRRLLQVRTRELRTLRRLAQQVLLQRSEVEAFLVSSIQMVRAQLAAEAAARGAGAAVVAAGTGGVCAGLATNGQCAAAKAGQPLDQTEQSSVVGADSNATTEGRATPEAAAGAAQGSPANSDAPGGLSAAATAGGPAVDIRALSWQDRERVLRLLFAKINKAAAQVRRCPACVGWLALQRSIQHVTLRRQGQSSLLGYCCNSQTHLLAPNHAAAALLPVVCSRWHGSHPRPCHCRRCAGWPLRQDPQGWRRSAVQDDCGMLVV